MMSQTCLMRDILSRIAARMSPLGGGANGHQHRKAAITAWLMSVGPEAAIQLEFNLVKKLG
jgi:hypothetical protein